jgi:hypothetical protein
MPAATAWLSAETVDQVAKETSSGKYVNPSKLEESKEHRFRLFGTGVTGFEVWTVDNKPVRYATKPDDADLPPNVKVEESTGTPSVRRFLAGLVYDYAAEDFKILQLTQKGLMNGLFKYMQDEDFGDPTDYDIKLTRKGSGLKTEYSLVAAPPKPVAKTIEAEYAELYCNLEALFEGKDPFEAPQG